MRGTIALDIDGTLTVDSNHLPMKTVDYLASLVAAGWRLIFITGRTFQSSFKALSEIPFMYYLAVQNGAIILEMPSKRVIGKKYLTRSVFQELEKICQEEPSDFVVYGGFEHQDQCYYRPNRFSRELLDYLHERVSTYGETWHAVESFDDMELDNFPSVKCFGRQPSAEILAERIERGLGLHVPLIRDPFREGYYVVQATHADISKGKALEDLITLTKQRGKIIAAGDDHNDIPMLAVADVKIVMSTAPSEVLSKADIIASPAKEEGIINALEAALKYVGNYRF